MSFAGLMLCDAKLSEPKENAAANAFEVDDVVVEF